ncbi:MAG: Imm26 family immunity protein [Crocinitomicaceae bacterium]|nr:Imm26 family immunity protein [Crocinitomicaceae bacterium]
MNYLEEKEGNIFFIPLFLPNGIKDNNKSYTRKKFETSAQYAFGRLIEIDKSAGDLVEIFNYIGTIPSDSSVITESGLMFKPFHIAMAFSKKRWRFIFETPAYDKEKDSNYSEISFLMGNRDSPIHWKGGEKNPFGGDPSLYERWIIHPPTKVEDMIRDKKN